MHIKHWQKWKILILLLALIVFLQLINSWINIALSITRMIYIHCSSNNNNRTFKIYWCSICLLAFLTFSFKTVLTSHDISVFDPELREQKDTFDHLLICKPLTDMNWMKDRVWQSNEWRSALVLIFLGEMRHGSLTGFQQSRISAPAIGSWILILKWMDNYVWSIRKRQKCN